MEKKVTKKDMFERIMGETNSQEIINFCRHEIELLERKSNRSSSKTQVANDKIRTEIVESLRLIGKPVTITEMQELDENMAQYSNQKISGLLRALVDNKTVTKTIDKKKSYFSVED